MPKGHDRGGRPDSGADVISAFHRMLRCAAGEETPPSLDPIAGLYLGSAGGPRGVGGLS